MPAASSTACSTRSAIWNVARSGAQIAADRTAELTSGTGLVARYGLDEGSGHSLASSVAGGPTGTAINGPPWTAGFAVPRRDRARGPHGPDRHARATASSVLAWTANAEPDLAGYHVFRSQRCPVHMTGDALGGTALVTGTAYTDTTAVNDTEYHYASSRSTPQPSRARRPSPRPPPRPRVGAALEFDGSNDYVTFGAAAGLGVTDFTIETWFRRDGPGSHGNDRRRRPITPPSRS